MLHLCFLAIAAGCFTAAWWQIHRAMAGNTLSYLYSVEWPAFVVVAGIGWWQMFHDTPADIAARKAHHARMRAASAEVVARTLPRSALAITVGSQEVPGSARALESAQASANGTLVVAGGRALSERDANGEVDPDDADEGGPVDEMTAYNRYLALLAVKGKPKTWRNPRGV